MLTIPLTNSTHFGLVDDALDEVLSYKWYAMESRGNVYVRCTQGGLFLHHYIAGFPLKGWVIDHKDRNPLNNQLNNLRITTQSRNMHNASYRSSETNTTGIRYRKDRNKYQVRITVNYKEITVGSYTSLEAAIAARQAAKLHYVGE
jgi:hypothetical protein